MPQLSVRKASEIPTPSRAPKAAREQQEMYDSFVRQIGSDVGQLELEQGEQARGIKVRLRRAASRLNTPLEIWDVDGRVYFQIQSKTTRRRGRPRKSE